MNRWIAANLLTSVSKLFCTQLSALGHYTHLLLQSNIPCTALVRRVNIDVFTTIEFSTYPQPETVSLLHFTGRYCALFLSNFDTFYSFYSQYKLRTGTNLILFNPFFRVRCSCFMLLLVNKIPTMIFLKMYFVSVSDIMRIRIVILLIYYFCLTTVINLKLYDVMMFCKKYCTILGVCSGYQLIIYIIYLPVCMCMCGYSCIITSHPYIPVIYHIDCNSCKHCPIILTERSPLHYFLRRYCLSASFNHYNVIIEHSLNIISILSLLSGVCYLNYFAYCGSYYVPHFIVIYRANLGVIGLYYIKLLMYNIINSLIRNSIGIIHVIFINFNLILKFYFKIVLIITIYSISSCVSTFYLGIRYYFKINLTVTTFFLLMDISHKWSLK